MPQLPVSSRLSLWGACDRIAEFVSERSPSKDRISRSLLGALIDGQLVATGDFQTLDGRIIGRNQPIFADNWRGVSEHEFRDAMHRDRVINLRPSASPSAQVWAINVTIETKQLDDWLSPGPKPNRSSETNFASAETSCEKWLFVLAETRELQKRAKLYWLAEAGKKFEGLSDRAFFRAWSGVARKYPEITRAGPKRKKPAS